MSPTPSRLQLQLHLSSIKDNHVCFASTLRPTKSEGCLTLGQRESNDNSNIYKTWSAEDSNFLNRKILHDRQSHGNRNQRHNYKTRINYKTRERYCQGNQNKIFGNDN